MKLTKLEIRRKESYETGADIYGLVELTGPTGKQAITLSPGAISRIISVIGVEIQDTARENAKLVKKAVAEAADQCLLQESDGALPLEA